MTKLPYASTRRRSPGKRTVEAAGSSTTAGPSTCALPFAPPDPLAATGSEPAQAGFLHGAEGREVKVHKLHGRRVQGEGVVLLVEAPEALLYLPHGVAAELASRQRHPHGVLLTQITHVGKALRDHAFRPDPLVPEV